MAVAEQAPVWAGSLILAALAAVCTALVAITHSTTAPRIAANEQAYLEQSLKPVLEGIEYDGMLSESTIEIPLPHELPGNQPVTVYRVFAGGEPVAALFVVKAMDGFRQGRFDILVATDIAARGIDVEQVSHVVNFDMPGTVDAYTHRIGRTGRSRRKGKAYTFVTGEDQALVDAVQRRLGATIPHRKVDGLAALSFLESRSGRAPQPGARLRPVSGRRGKYARTPGKRRRSGRPRYRRAS